MSNVGRLNGLYSEAPETVLAEALLTLAALTRGGHAAAGASPLARSPKARALRGRAVEVQEHSNGIAGYSSFGGPLTSRSA